MKIRNVCLDLDDTLIPNTHAYHVPNLTCAAVIARALGRHGLPPARLLELRERIDREMVDADGFAVDRVPRSWVATYERLCREKGRPVRPKVAERLMREGSRFARGPFRPLPGVHRMLQRLSAQGRMLHLVTAGDEALQRRKAEEAGIAARVDSVRITPMRKRDILASIVGDRPEEGVMVGDSLRSDMQPAIELGMTAVHVPCETWSYAHADLDPTKFHRLDDVRQLPEFLASLEREEAA